MRGEATIHRGNGEEMIGMPTAPTRCDGWNLTLEYFEISLATVNLKVKGIDRFSHEHFMYVKEV